MTTRPLTLIAAIVLGCTLTSGTAFSQQPPAPQQVSMFADAEKPSGSLSNAAPSAQELRQARALYQSQQRIARLERRAWIGQEPLRPTWNSVPMTSSRYPYRPTIYIPVFYYGR